MAKKKLGTSCKECPANCCTFGTGEKILPVRKFLDGYMTTDSWNTSCENLTPQRTCGLWGTPKLPVECRVHVCHNRQFSKEEIAKINAIDERTCPNCGVEWMVTSQTRTRYIDHCDVCGELVNWKVAERTPGLESLRKRKKTNGKK